MGLTDFLISFSIIMMMLSFISERASNFIKLYFPISHSCILIKIINGNYSSLQSSKFWLTASLLRQEKKKENIG